MRQWIYQVVFGLVGLGTLGGVVGCSSPRRAVAQGIPSGALRGSNVLLVTIDTLRADHLGAYGSSLGLTPTLDRFAREGLRFNVARAHVPLTLPSHTTIMTGLYPPANAVRDNGSFRFDGAHTTLAVALKHAGYSTAAFVGSFVLDARFGLNAGFDEYDDRMHGSSSNLEVVQRTAEQVLAPAADWILESSNPHPPAPGPQTRVPPPPAFGPWFAWVHLYDPHEPYTPPEPFSSRHASDPYSGEVAYADFALGAFFERLRAAGALSRALVVITSDHGESLGEHGERTHGLFAYDSTLRVPLLMWAPPSIRPGVVARPARLVDIMPTVLDLVGVGVPAALDGRSARSSLGEGPLDDDGSYFEALNANLTRNWAPLKGMVRNGVKLVDLPVPELYDLSSDPGETRNLYASQRERARDLESRLDRLNAAVSRPAIPAPVDPDAAARLRSLGYVVGTVAKPARAYTAADDPKRLVHLNAALDDAAAMWSRGDGPGAIDTLQAVLKERPDLTTAYDRLAFMLRASGRIGDAVALLDAAARAGHADRSLLRLLGSLLRDAGDLTRAIAVLEPLARQDAADLETLDALGQAYARAGRSKAAESSFRAVLAASPNAAATWANLGALQLIENRAADARDTLSRAIAINPDLASAHNGLGVAYARLGRRDLAVEEWRRALNLRPGYPDALSNLQREGR
jgi:arylsulfatase A-like enzyme/Flp pilus assembly protein TadD